MKFPAISVLAAVAVATNTVNALNGNGTLIVGGAEVQYGQELYVTGLRDTVTSAARCGGSLIAPKLVLTAAHCVSGWINYASIGSHFVSGSIDGERIRVVNAIRHPMYKDSSSSYDFAILELETASIITPMTISYDDDSFNAPGAIGTVRGWGTTSEGGTQSDVLKEVGVKIWNNDDCKVVYPVVDGTMICAGGALGEDSCQGDSGGPLTVVRNGIEVQVGIVSFGDGCARQNIPGVYSRLSQAKDFIESFPKN